MNYNKTFIIAEAGVNHNCSLELAKKMIDVAIEAGVDAVKFQTFNAEKVVSRYATKAEYQKKTTTADESQLEMIKKLELDVDAHRELIAHCQQKNIEFLSTPFDLESIDLLNKLGLETFKIPSGEINKVRPAVISDSVRLGLDEYRGFRHVVRNVYTYKFDSESVEKLTLKAEPLFSARTKTRKFCQVQGRR